MRQNGIGISTKAAIVELIRRLFVPPLEGFLLFGPNSVVVAGPAP
jgi:hypothetical protein